MAIGSIINLGGGGGSISGAKGVIICDTSTMTVGDTIRVRDVYDSLNVQNKQVVTVGTPVIFEVEPYCYYKICMVQTIDDTPTEIGGTYRSVDLGQTIFLNVLDKTTLGGIQGILNAHQEMNVLNIGDEVTVKSNNADWIMQVGAINLYESHEVILVSKYFWSNAVKWAQTWSAIYYDNMMKDQVEAFYNSLSAEEQAFVKPTQKSCRVTNTTESWKIITCNAWIPNKKEIIGSSSGTPTLTQLQFPIFTTQSQRARTTPTLTSGYWWTCDGANYNQSTQADAVVEDGSTVSRYEISNSFYMLPCIRLTADS